MSDELLLWRHLWRRVDARQLDLSAQEKVESHDWPGGVHEMEEVVRHVHRCAPGAVITAEDFPPLPMDRPIDLPKMLADLEMAYIERAIERANGSKVEAARMLGMGRTTLVEKLRRRKARE